jgi:type II secretory ATPase GspE/PulE/Tfp pilus assembly ATPase PilB-like protein
LNAPIISSSELKALRIPSEILKLLSVDVIKRHGVFPIEIKEGKLVLAVSNSISQNSLRDIRKITGYELTLVMAEATSISEALDRHVKSTAVAAYCKELDLHEGVLEARTPNLADRLFELAFDRRASDVHLEPQPSGLFVRFRIDGVLHTIHEFPRSAMASLISRIKIMASMDISEKRLPQDGQINLNLKGQEVDLRISTVPSKHGEKLVARLLDKSTTLINLSRLGMNPEVQSQFERLVDKPQGIILVTGPTGSGKSTTLYAVLNRLKSPLKNIITLEDPVEYELISGSGHEAGATQIQVHSKIGLTFAAGLRAALRQDPDILMVGEIRDHETAEVSIKAAMTGHLVLSSLHTNNAADTLGRLHDIGIEPYLTASTLLGIMAQRLVRVLCPACKQPYQLPESAIQNIFAGRTGVSKLALFRPAGCDKCQWSGYWGRRGIYELLVMNENIRELIHRNAPSADIKAAAVSGGMKRLRESGLDLVYQGLTTVEEVFRNTLE